jgi:hypothetical protein
MPNNTVDKLWGKAMLAGEETAGSLLVTTGRISMVRLDQDREYLKLRRKQRRTISALLSCLCDRCFKPGATAYALCFCIPFYIQDSLVPTRLQKSVTDRYS